jgi:hypothetical protein
MHTLIIADSSLSHYFGTPYFVAKSHHCSREKLYVMNPIKFHATEYFLRFHEQRGDKVLIFRYGLQDTSCIHASRLFAPCFNFFPLSLESTCHLNIFASNYESTSIYLSVLHIDAATTCSRCTSTPRV